MALLLLCGLALKSCQTLCSPVDCSLPGSSVHGILQARVLEWVAVPFSTPFLTVLASTWIPQRHFHPWTDAKVLLVWEGGIFFSRFIDIAPPKYHLFFCNVFVE